MTKKRTKNSSKNKSNHTNKKKKKKSSEINTDEQDFPLQIPGNFSIFTPDIFLEIMTRLPIKSLSKSKYVCKTWYNLILNPNFAKLHYSKSLQTLISPCVLTYDRYNTFHLIDHQQFDDRNTLMNVCSVNLKGFDQVFRGQDFDIVGSVNGLVCISPEPYSFPDSDFYFPLPYYVCNPITRDYVVLPKSPEYDTCPAFSGFGFDSSSGEYKVIRILQNEEVLRAKAEVYTLGLNGWREITSVPYIFDGSSTNVLVNGSLHWLSQEPIGKLSIVCFVVGKEEFRVIPFNPSINYDNKCTSYCLGVLGEYLCVIEYNMGAVSGWTEFWVMKEYGVEGSWVKEYMFRNGVMRKPDKGGYKLTKLRNGEFLLEYEGKKLGYYNPESGTRKHIELMYSNRLGYVQADSFVGSLFSPPKNPRYLRVRGK